MVIGWSGTVGARSTLRPCPTLKCCSLPRVVLLGAERSEEGRGVLYMLHYTDGLPTLMDKTAIREVYISSSGVQSVIRSAIGGTIESTIKRDI